jgi:hypothetical protein
MDREQLKLALGSFKSACMDKGYIDANTPEAFAFDEIYQGIFIVTVWVKSEWIAHQENPLNELIDLLYASTEPETRRSILTLRLAEDVDYSDFLRNAA